MGDLGAGVDAGVGAAAGVDGDGGAEEAGEGGFEGALDGGAGGLALPAEVGGAVVGNGGAEAHNQVVTYSDFFKSVLRL